MLDAITHESVIRLATQQTLPSPPRLVIHVLRVLKSDDFELSDLVDVIESDMSTAAAVVSAANSAASRGVVEVGNVREAIGRLGVEATRDRVMHHSMQAAFHPRHPALSGLLSQEWAIASSVGTLLRRAASPDVGLDDADTAFTLGLFHNIGMVPLLCAAPALIDLGEPSDYYQAARHHASALGGALARRWRLGDTVYGVALHCLNPKPGQWSVPHLCALARQICARRAGHLVACDDAVMEQLIEQASLSLGMDDPVTWLEGLADQMGLAA